MIIVQTNEVYKTINKAVHVHHLDYTKVKEYFFSKHTA
jgi:hypothetical protein